MKKVILLFLILSVSMLFIGCKSAEENKREEIQKLNKQILGIDEPPKNPGKYGEPTQKK